MTWTPAPVALMVKGLQRPAPALQQNPSLQDGPATDKGKTAVTHAHLAPQPQANYQKYKDVSITLLGVI